MHSSVGGGTDVKPCLPMPIASHLQTTEAAVRTIRDQGCHGRDRTVLVADDESEIRNVLCEILGECGYRTLAAGTTPDAIDVLLKWGADLVLSDLTMPGGDGRLILQAARALPHVPPVLFLTGHVEVGLEASLVSQGAAGCIHKPFSIRDVLAAVALHAS